MSSGASLDCDGNYIQLTDLFGDYQVKTFPDGSKIITGFLEGGTDATNGTQWFVDRKDKIVEKKGVKKETYREIWTSPDNAKTYRNTFSFTRKDGVLIRESANTCQ